MAATSDDVLVSDDCLPAMSRQCLDWSVARKISTQTLIRNQIHERKVLTSRKHAGMEDAIVFPALQNGQTVGAKYRTLDRRFGQAENFCSVWYGVDDVVGQDVVIVVEGIVPSIA